jgi:predicted TIM-barrel fold metal-dependent hydrolase
LSAAGAVRVDADVHCFPGSSDALRPYLPEYWQDYVDLAHFTPKAVNLVYPRWLPMLGNRGPDSVERLQEEVLRSVDRAILNCYWAVESISHPDLSIAAASAVNRWLHAEWLDRDDRLLASAVINPEYVPEAVAEIERVAEDPRFVQVLVPARSAVGYGHRRFWPIWEALAEHRLVLGITFGGVTGVAPTSSNWLGTYYEDYSAATLAYQCQIISLIMQGVLAKIPELRVSVIESGWTWAPAWMWRMDQWWKSLHREVPWVTSPPSTYVRRHFRFTTQPCDAPLASAQLRHAYEQLGGAAMLMYASDYPHSDGRSPEDVLASLPADAHEAVSGANAVEWYGLEQRVPAASG